MIHIVATPAAEFLRKLTRAAHRKVGDFTFHLTPKASVWQLADDARTYGNHRGWFILTTPDGEHEFGFGMHRTVEGAARAGRKRGYQIVPLDLDASTKGAR